MEIIKNIQIPGKHDRPILADVYFKKNQSPKKLVIFCHGYKGYKDWGAWNSVAEYFANNNVFFVKMNFSHNGGTVEQPIDFPDLEAFGKNNFIIEIDDLDAVINWIHQEPIFLTEIDYSDISLVGHSRGGAIVLLKAAEDKRIKKVITWAGVSDFACRFPKGEELDMWKKNGVAYVTNSRTHQEMPHYYQFYTTFKENEARLNIQSAGKKLNIPLLVIHGDKDETVKLDEALNLHSWSEQSIVEIVEGGNHTFGISHPWNYESLPDTMQLVVEKTFGFLATT